MESLGRGTLRAHAFGVSGAWAFGALGFEIEGFCGYVGLLRLGSTCRVNSWVSLFTKVVTRHCSVCSVGLFCA